MPKTIKKQSVKHTEQKQENIKETVEDLRVRLKDNQRALIMGIAAFIFVLICVGGFMIYSKSQAEKADALQQEAYRAFYNEGNAQPAVAAENFKKAMDLYKKSYDAKKRADVLLYIAYCQYALGSYDEAIASLKDLNSKFSDPAITSLSYYKLSETYLKKEDAGNAMAALNSIVMMKDSVYKDMALMQIAKILESQGKVDEAKAKYKELASRFPNSVFATEAKARSAQ